MDQIDLGQLEDLAHEVLDDGAFAYMASGSDDEETLRANEAAWRAVRLLPRVLRDVSSVSTATTLLGRERAHPVVVAPTAMHLLASPDAEVATARAAARVDAPFVVSLASNTSVETLAARVPGARLWMHVTMVRDRGVTRAMCERAAAAGCEAVVMTVDCTVPTRRPRSERTPWHLPAGAAFPNFDPDDDSAALYTLAAGFDPTVTFDDIEVVSAWAGGLPVLVKGVLRADDAAECVDAGAGGVIVSNHGGRSLDQTVPTAWALPDVVDAVDGRVDVLVDGGLRRGTHVLAALACGADGVMIGRSGVYGLAVGGEDGAVAVLDELLAGLRRALTLCGATRLDQVDRSLLWSLPGR